MNTTPRWSVVLPYFNEAGYLPATLAALLAQELRPLQLILVDNASTDDTTARCHALLDGRTDVRVIYLQEPRPGKTNALETGLARVDTEFVAFCDADTYYPPHYLRRCDEIFAATGENVMAAMAQRVTGPPTHGKNKRRMIKSMVRSWIYDRQCLTGGYGQSFRAAGLRAAGGFSTKLWPYVFEDHEVMQRIFRIGGRSRYDFHLWCIPSMRRGERGAVDWTEFEKRLYGLTPFALKDWYFYTFLARRFEARQQFAVKLREQTWQ